MLGGFWFARGACMTSDVAVLTADASGVCPELLWVGGGGRPGLSERAVVTRLADSYQTAIDAGEENPPNLRSTVSVVCE